MEASKPLATESFSYSWLVDIKPHSSEESIDKDQNFDFDVSFAPSHFALVHADEIFSEGHMLPVYVETSLRPVSPSPVSSSGDRFARKEQFFFLGRWRKSSGRFWKKCFRLVQPLYQTIRCSRKCIRVDDLDRKVCEVRRWSNSAGASPGRSSVVDWIDVDRRSSKGEFYFGFNKAKSPNFSPARISPARSSGAWCGDENSIHEAILYCKRSIEK